MNVVFVFLGGGVGSIFRYLISKYTTSNFQHINPIGTLSANFLASLTIAFLIYFAHHKYGLSQPVKLLLVTGFCGGFSTFSTFSYETYELIRMGMPWYAVANVLLSLALCIPIIFIISKLS